jgi:hypothetical protein
MLRRKWYVLEVGPDAEQDLNCNRPGSILSIFVVGMRCISMCGIEYGQMNW